MNATDFIESQIRDLAKIPVTGAYRRWLLTAMVATLSRFERRIPYLPPEELERRQRTRLRVVIDHAFQRVPFKWAMTYARPFYAHQRMIADPVLAAPALTKLLKARIAKTPGLAEKISRRTEEIGRRHAEIRGQWRKQAEGTSRLAHPAIDRQPVSATQS